MGDKPSIKKITKGPYNKSKVKKPKFSNISVRKMDTKVKIASIRKKPRPLHNESLTKGEVYRKEAFAEKYEKYKEKNNIDDEHSERINMQGAFKEENNSKENRRKAIGIIVLIFSVFIGAKFIVSCIEDTVEENERKAKVFKGKEYFSYLGISKTDQFEESLYETDELQEVDNIAVGKYDYDGETYYRFQARHNGKSAYDSEITNYQGEIETSLDGSRPMVDVYKRVYTKSNGSKVSIFYYKLKVPSNKIKKLN
ncbi:hypothetical protein SAMN02745163_03410 [Clostridium cavendishii DSM 21758]|uniref:Uncharacterized protein n=1 Tax=Clostridium cavendishii DSM 21758 TaxID=1121302 RepID=A0A1M6QIL8_9CLOT|nr:hypothetical protein [Clostridium cavendishii]SHK19867.1 hypothetical protein SAMN02745163_03410 [Clostridium cavendishii DSM 21758]